MANRTKTELPEFGILRALGASPHFTHAGSWWYMAEESLPVGATGLYVSRMYLDKSGGVEVLAASPAGRLEDDGAVNIFSKAGLVRFNICLPDMPRPVEVVRRLTRTGTTTVIRYDENNHKTVHDKRGRESPRWNHEDLRLIRASDKVVRALAACAETPAFPWTHAPKCKQTLFSLYKALHLELPQLPPPAPVTPEVAQQTTLSP